MEKPKVRHIEAHPFVNQGKEMVLLRDSEGLSEGSLVVSEDVVFMVSLMDGTRTLRDLQLEYMRTYGQILYMEKIEEIVTAMDKSLFLANDRYQAHLSRIKEEYEAEQVRKPFLAGKSYPENRTELLALLDEMFGTGHEEWLPEGDIVALLAPHIDYARGGGVYKKTYPFLKSVRKPLIVVFGTSHQPTERIWSISLKDFSTPLDVIPNSRDLGELVLRDRTLKEYVTDWPHRSEHSIELQLPLMQFNLAHDFEMLPILTGSMHEYVSGTRAICDDEPEMLVESLKSVLAAYGKPFLIIAGADLAHIGAQFGDRHPLDAQTLARSKRKDQEILRSIEAVDAQAFFQTIKEERDERRICGLTPIYFLLRLLEGCRGKVVGYDQWTDRQSSVSFAGGVFYREP